MENNVFLFIGNIGPELNNDSENAVATTQSGVNYYSFLVDELQKRTTLFVDSIIYSSGDRGMRIKDRFYVYYPGKYTFVRRILNAKKQYIHNYKKMHISKKQSLIILVDRPLRPSLKAAISIKKRHQNSKIIVFVPDLPNAEFSSTTKSFVYHSLKSLDGKLIKKMLKFVDGYVLYTDQMKNCLPEKPYIVIEAISPNSVPNIKVHNHKNKNVVFYGGSLFPEYSIYDFASEFIAKSGDENVLWIAGKGPDETRIASINSAKFRFLGLKTNFDTQSLMAEADLCINPRLPVGDYTKYSFPSKTMDYLVNCGIVATHKLNGIPKEYDEALFYPSEASTSSLVDLVLELCEKRDDKINHVEAARKRLLVEKSVEKTADKLLLFISRLV